MAKIDQSKFGLREQLIAERNGVAAEFGIKELVFDYVCEVTDLTREDLIEIDRVPRVVEARVLFVALVRHVRPGISYSVIGRWLGNRCNSQMHEMHMAAIATRMKDPRFADYFSGFMALYRLTGEVPYACE